MIILKRLVVFFLCKLWKDRVFHVFWKSRKTQKTQEKIEKYKKGNIQSPTSHDLIDQNHFLAKLKCWSCRLTKTCLFCFEKWAMTLVFCWEYRKNPDFSIFEAKYHSNRSLLQIKLTWFGFILSRAICSCKNIWIWPMCSWDIELWIRYLVIISQRFDKKRMSSCRAYVFFSVFSWFFVIFKREESTELGGNFDLQIDLVILLNS